MITSNETHSKKRVRLILVLLILAVVIGLGVGAWWLIQGEAAQAAGNTTSAYQTTTVRRGNLSISITGTGNVVSTQMADLGFTVEGTVGKLTVQVGDQVTAGQTLAVLDNLDELKLAIKNQELAVAKAQKEISDLSNADLNLAQAYSDMATAQTTYDEAQKNVHYKGDSRCAPSRTQEYYFQWLYAQQAVDEWEGYLAEGNTGYSQTYILEKLAPMRKTRDQALANYKYCQSYTDEEIQDSQAALSLAKANLDKATQYYEDLKASGGIDEQAIDIAQANLKNAQLQLIKAQNNLAGATITAPIAGTVMTVNGEVGDSVGTGTFITLADLTSPELQVTIDESDLANLAVGCPVQITFDSIENKSFSGMVSEVSPALVTTSFNVSKVQGTVKFEEGALSGVTLTPGLAASIEVTCQQRDNVLIVASQALYNVNGKPAYVYVLNSLGQPEKREVEVGMETVATAEILSGLQEGEKVLLSQVEGQ
jgi:HlyD family secretion protein